VFGLKPQLDVAELAAAQVRAFFETPCN